MKKQNLNQNLRQSLALSLVAASVLMLLATACTKSRDPSIKDGELQSEIFAISAIDGKTFGLKTESTAVTKASDQKINVLDEKPSVKIKSSSAPGGLQKIFSNIVIKADEGQDMQIRLALRLQAGKDSALHVLRVVQDENSLSELEKQTEITLGKDKQKVIPLFKVAVTDYGKICRVKDANGDETSELKLCHTDPEHASHVQLSVIKNDRSPYLASDALKEVFLASGINGKVSTLATLKDKLNVSLSPADDTKVVSYVDGKQGSKVGILIYKILKNADITDEKLRKKLQSDVKLGDIGNCDDSVLAQLPSDYKKDCVVLFAYSIEADAVQAEVKTQDDMAADTIAISFKPAEGTESARLLKIAAKSPVKTIYVDSVNALNPYNTILAKDLRDREFLLRRTFEDGAASIQVYGPGASGEVDIVKFEFEDTRLVVRRATAKNGMQNSDSIDREELMSIPVHYLGIDPSSSSFNPKLIDANKDTASYVLLDWTTNTLPVVNSPLAFFEDGACFASVGSQSITDLDNRIQNGILNFSISGTYSFTRDCMSQYQMRDYWYGGGLQAAFNIKERVSFMLHTGALDSKAVDLPFRAQNLMGFGLFTAGKIVPDSSGNQGAIGTQQSNLVIHDFTGGKQLVYSLGGLPTSDSEKWIKDDLIEGTKEVIAEWNQGLHLAFKGTDLDRSGDFIILKVDGLDQDPGHLGDLDRNYIWNYQKNLDSGLLGMSQAAPNPRSGRIEQNNILMYSGNLVSNIGMIKERARLINEYHNMKAKVLAADQAGADSQDNTSDQPPALDPNDPNGGLTIENGQAPIDPKVRSQFRSASQVLIKQMNAIAAVELPRTPLALKVTSKNDIKASAANLMNSIKTAMSNRHDSGDSDARKQDATKTLTDRAYLQRIFQKAIEMNATRDEVAMNALTAAEILKSYGSSLSNDQKMLLSAQSRRLALMSEFNKNFRKGPNCAIIAAEATMAGHKIDPNLLDDSKTSEVFKSWYKSTLLHEMGHSLGLTHNFAGSTDKANFAFKKDSDEAKDEEKGRNYSSIMDYIPDQYTRYFGPGVYDVHALRAAYTGLIEVNPSLEKFVVKADGKSRLVIPQTQVDIPLQTQSENEQFQMEVKLEDLRKALLGDQTWWSLDARTLARLPLKNYHYCTDVHVGGDPSCNRWDLGTDNQEIAKFYADEYRDLYPALNSRGRNMNMRSFSNYISHIYTEFFAVRAMVDETFYLAMSNQPQSVWLPSALGSIEGLALFSQVVNTPTKASPYESLDRFAVFTNKTKDKNGKESAEKIMVESKSNTDLFVPGMPDEIETRGIEFDKAIALMMLTQRGTGNPRYQSMNLRISYADFEKYILGAEASQSTTLQTVKAVLADNPIAVAIDSERNPVMLPATFKPEVTETVRYYAGLAAGMLLDADTLEDKLNFASFFRTGSSQKSVPKDRFAVAKLDQSMASTTSLKLWSLDNASISDELTRAAAQKRALIEASAQLVLDLNKAFAAVKSKDAVAEKEAKGSLVKQLTALNKNGLLLTKEESTQVTFARIIDATVSFMIQNDMMLEEILPLVSSGKVSVEALPNVLADEAHKAESMAKELPYFGLAQKALLSQHDEKSKDANEQAKAAILGSYLNAQTLENNHNVVVANLSLLNKLLYVLYPELNRSN